MTLERKLVAVTSRAACLTTLSPVVGSDARCRSAPCWSKRPATCQVRTSRRVAFIATDHQHIHQKYYFKAEKCNFQTNRKLMITIVWLQSCSAPSGRCRRSAVWCWRLTKDRSTSSIQTTIVSPCYLLSQPPRRRQLQPHKRQRH